MKKLKVKDLMVPLQEYAVIGEESSIYEAVLALEKAQREFSQSQSRYRHRAILVEDKNHKIVGKLGQLDILRSLEPKYQEMKGDLAGMSKYGFSKTFLLSMLENYHLFDRPMDDVCRKAGQEKVHKYMHRPTEGEYVAENDCLDTAIHLLVVGRHQSLLVAREDAIVGLLRLTDVFTVVFDKMKACDL